MATHRTSTTVKKVIRLTREEVEAILKAQFQTNGEVDWDISGHGFIEGVELTHEVTTYLAEENL